jgi:hypothetical protein
MSARGAPARRGAGGTDERGDWPGAGRPAGPVIATCHQTARLTAGRHESPEHGTCVMELASMLAGEPFGDHPRSVCRVIAAFLRRYNDSVDPERRATLYPYAAKAVGTRGSWRLRRARARRCAEWHRRALGRRRGPLLLLSCVEWADAAACAAAARPGSHESALVLLDELVAMGRGDGGAPDLPPAPIGVSGGREA